MNILLAITFVFGVLRLLTFLKVFGYLLVNIENAIVIIPLRENILKVLGVWFFYFSLIFQSWYWIFKT